MYLNQKFCFDLLAMMEDGFYQLDNIVLTLDPAFVSDRALSELVDGEFTVLGKVTRTITQGERVNLLRKTSLGKFQAQQLEELTQSFGQMRRGA